MAQIDPGVRPGPAAAGGAFAGLSAAEKGYFPTAKAIFQEVDSVFGNLAGEDGKGLGPMFNGNSCAQCHAFPAVGGSSPRVNPQVALATLDGANNIVPSFIRSNGPVREARFIVNLNTGAPDGGVHDLYTITGRVDSNACNLSQPDFATNLAFGNVIFRIPTPVFGAGLIEALPDVVIRRNLQSDPSGLKGLFGINGVANSSGNDGSVTRFGWKAQNKSMTVFAGEAYNVEQGVTNELFTNERTNACNFNGVPEDFTNVSSGTAAASDITNFAVFMRMSAPPAPVSPLNLSQTRGQQLFSAIGCNLCHTPTLNTGKSTVGGMSNVDVNLYSDLGLHHMGNNLNDGISQGAAGADQFRTAPLWGLGQRVFFLHDGRTSDLQSAITAHRSAGSEANQVILNYLSLSAASKQDLLNFLRAL